MIHIVIFITFLIILIIIKKSAKKVIEPELFKAVKTNKLGLVEDALYKEGNVDITNKDGMTALSFSNYEISKFLIKKGADINVKDNGNRTALMGASLNYNYDKVKLLLDNGAYVNEIQDFGQTALIMCLVNAELYLPKEDEINTDKIIKLLINRGADINIKDSDGKIALDYAKRQEHIDILQKASIK